MHPTAKRESAYRIVALLNEAGACCAKAATIAELLAAIGGPANAEPLSPLLVSRAGAMVCGEISNIRRALQSLQKELVSGSAGA